MPHKTFRLARFDSRYVESKITPHLPTVFSKLDKYVARNLHSRRVHSGRVAIIMVLKDAHSNEPSTDGLRWLADGETAKRANALFFQRAFDD